ncbi:SHOCT domain-containing protein [Nocardia niwae]|uniref:SHOCT domain-containing protein n=1 Tax=Nocardia niwae TaxID=626084 RepID=UPI0007A3BA18|nr:SHOCT domain-containing protein [Nocardia niwae]
MNIFTRPEAVSFLADAYDGAWHPWPFFWILPLLFWLTAVTVLVVLVRRRFIGHASGVGALRTAYARGEITEEQYRSRLAVLSEPRHSGKR